jgi:CubicO group peptidase (beta-lactamase class C family)
MPNAKEGADAEVHRRAFIGGAAAAVAGLTLTPSAAACRQSKPATVAGDSEFARELDPFIKGLAAEDVFSGAVLVARDGRVIFEKAYGLASREFNVPNQVSTKFNLASMGKMFTGVAVAQLAERGRLAFDDLVGRHLPDYPREVSGRVTIHHLLTHTSGLGSYWKPEFHEANHARFRTVRDYFPLFVNDPPASAPGEKWAYSNAGLMVLGAVIEKVSGRSYFDYVKEQVFARAGMGDTDFYEADRVTPSLAAGYTKQNRYLRGSEEWTSNLFISPVKGGPAGGAYSTVGDMLRFDAALRAHRLLDRKHTEVVLAGKVEYRPGAKYAYGFANDTAASERIVFHDGGANGVSAEFDMYPDIGYTVVVLSNLDHPAARPVVKKAREVIAGGPR